MGRLIGGVVSGYLAMAFALFIALTIAYSAVGADRAPGSGALEVTLLWAILSFVAGFGSALLGGGVARAVSGQPEAPRWLAAIVFILGMSLALVIALGAPGGAVARTELIGPLQAMRAAQIPLWIAILNPFVGAAGVLLGGRALGSWGPVTGRTSRL
jgi:hypothetical protein